MSSTIQMLREHWQRRGLLNERVASAADIAAFEERHCVKLPEVLREYFTVLNGTPGGATSMEDDDHISFWHLDQVRSLAEECPRDTTPDARRLFVFADYLIWSHAWAVQLSRDGAAPAPVIITYDPGQQVALSFEEFLRRYVERDHGVLFPAVSRELPRSR